MRWVVCVEITPKTHQALFLPKSSDSEAFNNGWPVTITFAARFRTKKLASKAIQDAAARNFPMKFSFIEKSFCNRRT